MKLIVAAVGRPALEYARLAIAEYAERTVFLARPIRLEFRSVAPGNSLSEGRDLLAAVSGALVVALDPRGENLSSEAFSKRLERHIVREGKDLAFLIGGAEGHSAEVRSCAAWSLSLGPLTLQHELAQVVLLEQIYRAFTIIKGHPYHRGEGKSGRRSGG